jgi:peptide/nickel transport system substrate-binding protein
LWSIVLTFVILAGCAPSATPATPSSSSSAPAAPAARQGPKVLTIGLQRETRSFGNFGGVANDLAPNLAHQLLAFKNNHDVYEAQLATEQISVEKGTWRLNADGTMDTTWTLQPNAKWHDGAPFTADDLLLAFNVYKDKDLPSTTAGMMASMASASAPDPHTFAVHWSQTDVKADQAPGLTPLPAHLLGELYRTDKASLPSSPYLIGQFVGLGPYRLTNWDQGVQMELARFDDFYKGPAKIDRIVLRYIPDPTALVANILSGSVDVVTPPGVDVEAALNLKDRWAGTGNQVITQTLNSVNSAFAIQLRPEYAKPQNGLINRNVREALYRGIDRKEMAEVLTHGLAPLADSWIAPFDALRPQVEASIPQFPYDPQRAQQLLTEAGWVKGSDGLLVSQQTGEVFRTSVSGPERTDVQKQQSVIAPSWKALGVDAEIDIIPANLFTDRSVQATRPTGVLLGRIADTRYYYDKALTTKEISAKENNWSGRNTGGYSNPTVDSLMDRLGQTIDPQQRVSLTRELVQVAMQDISLMPFFWEVEPTLAVDSVVIPQDKAAIDYAAEWDKR